MPVNKQFKWTGQIISKVCQLLEQQQIYGATGVKQQHVQTTECYNSSLCCMCRSVHTYAEKHANLMVEHEGWGLIHHRRGHQVYRQGSHDLVSKQEAPPCAESHSM